MSTITNASNPPLFTSFLTLPYLAQTNSYYYGEGNYNNTVYNGEQSSGAIGLVNSGSIIGFTIIVGALIIFTAILVKIWKKPKKPSNSQKTE